MKSFSEFAVRSLQTLAFVLLATAMNAQNIPDTTYPSGDGFIYAIAADANNLYLGGETQDFAGNYHMGGHVFDSATGVAALNSLRFNGDVYEAVPDGAGGWYVGGSFTKIGNYTRKYIAHIDVNGVPTNWSANLNGPVFSMFKYGTRVYFGGSFTSVNSQSSNGRCASFDVNTGQILHVATFSSTVYDIDGWGGNVYFAGNFQTINATTRRYLAEIDTLNWALSAWNPNPSSSCSMIEMLNNKLYVGGNFVTISSTARHYAASYDLTTHTLTTWDPNLIGGYPKDFSSYNDRIYMCGGFTTVQSLPRALLCAVDTLTGTPLAWSVTANTSQIEVVKRHGDVLYVSGTFDTIAGQPRQCVAAFDIPTGNLSTWQLPGIGGYPECFAFQNQDIYIGGEYLSTNAQARVGAFAISRSTGTVTPWDPNVYGSSGEIKSIVPCGNTIYIGGSFTNAGGGVHWNVAAVDSATGLETPFTCTTGGVVNALAVDGNILYIGGTFISVSSVPREGFAALDRFTGQLLPLDMDLNGDVKQIIVNDTLIYICGTFTAVGSTPRNGIAVFGTSGYLHPMFDNYSTPGGVQTMALEGTNLYFAENSLGQIVRIYDLTGDSIRGDWYVQCGQRVYDIEVGSNRVYLAGDFQTVNSLPRRYVAAVDKIDGTTTAWNPSPDNRMRAIYLDESDSLLGVVGFPAMIDSVLLYNPYIYKPDYSSLIGGRVYYDLNNNATIDTTEPGYIYGLVTIQPINLTVSTDQYGAYRCYVNNGNYTASATLASYCSSTIPASATFSITTPLSIDTIQHLGLQCIPNVRDLRVTGTANNPIPGGGCYVSLTYRNNGTQSDTATMSIVLDTALTITYVNDSSFVQSGDTLWWTKVLSIGEQGMLAVHTELDTTAVIGQPIVISEFITPVQSDFVPNDNYDTLYKIVSGPYDPNVKLVDPSAPVLYPSQNPLQYTIHFQNTGTDTAHTVIIRDVLDLDFNALSLIVLASSHPCTFTISGNLLTFTFANALVPDSTTNEPQSHGFVCYTIKPNILPVSGTWVTNSADIYFDYAAPITTNIDSTLYDINLKSVAQDTENNFHLHPNPSDGKMKLIYHCNSTTDLVFTIFDLTGSVVYSQELVPNQTTAEINVEFLAPGLYFFQCGAENQIIGTGKIIIQR